MSTPHGMHSRGFPSSRACTSPTTEVRDRKFLGDCTPGYYNNEGKPGERSGQNTSYGKGSRRSSSSRRSGATKAGEKTWS